MGYPNLVFLSPIMFQSSELELETLQNTKSCFGVFSGVRGRGQGPNSSLDPRKPAHDSNLQDLDCFLDSLYLQILKSTAPMTEEDPLQMKHRRFVLSRNVLNHCIKAISCTCVCACACVYLCVCEISRM